MKKGQSRPDGGGREGVEMDKAIITILSESGTKQDKAISTLQAAYVLSDAITHVAMDDSILSINQELSSGSIGGVWGNILNVKSNGTSEFWLSSGTGLVNLHRVLHSQELYKTWFPSLVCAMMDKLVRYLRIVVFSGCRGVSKLLAGRRTERTVLISRKSGSNRPFLHRRTTMY